MLDTPQLYPRAGSQTYPSPAAMPNADGSTTVYFGPTQPAGVQRGNWIQTMPGKGWYTILRLYSPLEPFLTRAGGRPRSNSCRNLLARPPGAGSSIICIIGHPSPSAARGRRLQAYAFRQPSALVSPILLTVIGLDGRGASARIEIEAARGRVQCSRAARNSEWSADVRFGAHAGPKSDIPALPKSAKVRSPSVQPASRLYPQLRTSRCTALTDAMCHMQTSFSGLASSNGPIPKVADWAMTNKLSSG